MSEKAKLILHIGAAKAGSTTIQTFIGLNLDPLRGSHIFPCTKELSFELDSITYCAPLLFIESLAQRGGDGGRIVRANVERFLSQSAVRAKPVTLLVSSENLENAKRAAGFTNLADLLELHVVYYVRRYDDWILSSWKQWGMKSGKPLREYIEEALRTFRRKYQSAVQMWRGVEGVTSMRVRPLHPKGLVGGNLVSDFCEVLGLGMAGLEIPPPQNTSFDFDLTWALSQCPELFEGPDDHRILNLLEEHFRTRPPPPARDPIGSGARTRIFEAVREEYEWLGTEFFPDLDIEEIFGPPVGGSPVEPYEPDPLVALRKAIVALGTIALER